MKAMKAMNIICLLIWILQFIYGIIALCGKATITPIAFMCAVLICIFHHIEEIGKFK